MEANPQMALLFFVPALFIFTSSAKTTLETKGKDGLSGTFTAWSLTVLGLLAYFPLTKRTLFFIILSTALTITLILVGFILLHLEENKYNKKNGIDINKSIREIVNEMNLSPDSININFEDIVSEINNTHKIPKGKIRKVLIDMLD